MKKNKKQKKVFLYDKDKRTARATAIHVAGESSEAVLDDGTFLIPILSLSSLRRKMEP